MVGMGHNGRYQTRLAGNGDRCPATHPPDTLLDERYHTYVGYVLRLQGRIDDQDGGFLIGIGQGRRPNVNRTGDIVSGRSMPVEDTRLEIAEYYKTAGLKVISGRHPSSITHHPHIVPPDLEVYRGRGHCRLNARTYAARCESRIWGYRMALEMITPFDPQQRRYRTDTFCYGPQIMPILYLAGPVHTVPGRKGMVWQEEDWVDEDATHHRAMDE